MELATCDCRKRKTTTYQDNWLSSSDTPHWSKPWVSFLLETPGVQTLHVQVVGGLYHPSHTLEMRQWNLQYGWNWKVHKLCSKEFHHFTDSPSVPSILYDFQTCNHFSPLSCSSSSSLVRECHLNRITPRLEARFQIQRYLQPSPVQWTFPSFGKAISEI